MINMKNRSARDTVKPHSKTANFLFLGMTIDFLKDTIRSGKEDLKSVKQELSTIETGQLFSRRRGESIFFSRYDPKTKKELGISDDTDKIYDLARRHYLECRAATIANSLSSFENLLLDLQDINKRFGNRSKLDRFSDSELELSRILFSKEQNEWIDQPASPNPYHKEDLKYSTDNGLLTRSKSEAWIGSALEALGIPYRYDDFVEIRNDDPNVRPFHGSYYADFKIPNLNGGITIHEHLGAFYMDSYSANAFKKMNDYRNFSVYEIPGRQVVPSEFTWSFESDVHNKEMLRDLIRRMLIPESYLLG